MEPGVAHEEIDPLHSTSLLRIVSRGVSESPIALLIGTSSSFLISLVRKQIEFIDGDVGVQRTVDGVKNVSEGHIGAIGCVNIDAPREVY